MVQTRDPNENFPVPFENSTLWERATVVWSYHGNAMTAQELALNLASSAFFE